MVWFPSAEKWLGVGLLCFRIGIRLVQFQFGSWPITRFKEKDREEIEAGRRLPPLPFLFWYLELLVEVSCKPEVHFA